MSFGMVLYGTKIISLLTPEIVVDWKFPDISAIWPFLASLFPHCHFQAIASSDFPVSISFPLPFPISFSPAISGISPAPSFFLRKLFSSAQFFLEGEFSLLLFPSPFPLSRPRPLAFPSLALPFPRILHWHWLAGPSLSQGRQQKERN